MKPVRLSKHAQQQCTERGTGEDEVREAVDRGTGELAKRGRLLCRANFQYNAEWHGEYYRIKQVAPVILEESTEIVVITVYTFFF